MKNFNVGNKFKSLYYLGLSVIISLSLIVFLLLSALGGVIVGYFNNKVHDDVNIQKIEKVEPVPQKVILYDTVKVKMYDTVRVTPKKIKPVVIKEENTDSLK